MDKAEIRRMADFLIEVRASLHRSDEQADLDLAKLDQVVGQLMEANLTGPDQGMRVLLASLEYEARLCKQEIERRLALRN